MLDDEAWLTLREARERRDLRTLELVLSARGIESRVAYDAGTWQLLVTADDLLDANRELVAYDRENVPAPPVAMPAVIDNGYAGVAAYLAAIWLVMFCDTSAALGWDWRGIGRLQAARSPPASSGAS